jgi:hypothetical protein
VVAGLAEHRGEHAQQFGVGVDMANPASFVREAQQRLSDGEADQFTVGEIGSVTSTGAGRDDVVIDQDIECCQEGVQFFAHNFDLGHPPPAR